MNIQDTLGEILRMLMPRANGKTFAMLHGAKNCDCFVVVSNMSQADWLKEEGIKRDRFVSLNSLQNTRGINKAVVFDNVALEQVLREAYNEIERLKEYEWMYKDLNDET